MSFVNDYLTEEEKKQFREYQIKYNPKCTNNHKILGTEECWGGVWCTTDRDRKLYLFYCGDNYKERLDGLGTSEYFALVMIKDKPKVSYFALEQHIGVVDEDGYSVLWNMVEKDNKCKDNNVVLEYLKDALLIFGLDGDPQKSSRVVKCNF